MTFDIHADIFDDKDEEAIYTYRQQLEERFEQSPEGQATDTGWAGVFLDFLLNYVAVTPVNTSIDDLEEVLYELFPAKVLVPASEAPQIIKDLLAFWKFLQREFNLPNAEAFIQYLSEDKAAKRLEAALSDSSKFGITKSIMTEGLERGADLSSEEGINAWIMQYNRERMARPPSPSDYFSSPFRMPKHPQQQSHNASAKRKAKRKMEKNSRKQNRRKK